MVKLHRLPLVLQPRVRLYLTHRSTLSNSRSPADKVSGPNPWCHGLVTSRNRRSWSLRCGTLAGMSCWQYAQLTITVDGRALQPGTRTILWHGPGQGVGENYSDNGQTVLELLNRVGADGWELAPFRTTAKAGRVPATGRQPGWSRSISSSVQSSHGPGGDSHFPTTRSHFDS